MSILHLETLLENQLQATGELNPGAPHTRLHFPSGQTVVVPTHMLLQHVAAPGAAEPAEAPSAVAQPSPQQDVVAAAPEAAVSGLDAAQVIPLIEEHLEVSKRTVETARVHLRRETQEVQQQLTMPFQHTGWAIEHVPVNQVVEAPPPVRQSEDLIVFPLVEERVVVTRELFLREEVHVRRVVTTVEKTASIPLRKDVLIETRTDLTANLPDDAQAL